MIALSVARIISEMSGKSPWKRSSIRTCHSLRTALETMKLLAKDDLDSPAFGFLTECLMQTSAQEIDAWRSYLRPGPIADLAQTLAVPAPDHHARNWRSLA